MEPKTNRVNLIDINTMLCPIKVNIKTIELTLHPSCYYSKDLICVTIKRERIGITISDLARKSKEMTLSSKVIKIPCKEVLSD